MTKLVLYALFALGVSFLCSLLEAALLSVRIGTLSDQAELGNPGAARLLELKENRIDDALTAILTLNTVAHTIGATMAGAQAAEVFGSFWVGVFSAVFTLLILVASEIIPKTIGTVYAFQLTGFVGNTLLGITRAMWPVLVVSRRLTSLFTPRDRNTAPMSRGELSAVISMAGREGAISGQESTIFHNLLRFDAIRVEDVMTPRTVVFMMPATDTVADLLASREAEAFSRVPLYVDNRDNVVGYLLQRDVLKHAASGRDRTLALREFQRTIDVVPEMISVARALRRLLENREAIALVGDEHGGIAGLVTLEDLTETVLGVEIVDESDRVADLRQAAIALRDRRLRERRILQEERARLAEEEAAGAADEATGSGQPEDGGTRERPLAASEVAQTATVPARSTVGPADGGSVDAGLEDGEESGE